MKIIKLSYIIIVSFFFSCSADKNKADAFGNFEADDFVISSQSTGIIEYMDLEEGDSFTSRTHVITIDTMQLYYSKLQLIGRKKSIESKIQNIIKRIRLLEIEKKFAASDFNRISNMYKDKAISKQAYDKSKTNLDKLTQNIKVIRTENQGVLGQIEELNAKILATEDLIAKSKIYTENNSTILEIYKRKSELLTPGMPIFRAANISDLILRAYVSGDQLSQIALGDEVKVLIDADNSKLKEYKAKIIWISSESEFTPKIIQTRKERVKLVYAIKIKLKNDGELKIGMPAEVKFLKSN